MMLLDDKYSTHARLQRLTEKKGIYHTSLIIFRVITCWHDNILVKLNKIWLKINLIGFLLIWLTLYFYCQPFSKCHVLGSDFDPPFILYSYALIQFHGFKYLRASTRIPDLSPELLTCLSNGLLIFSTWTSDMHLILDLPWASLSQRMTTLSSFSKESLGVIFGSFLSLICHIHVFWWAYIQMISRI